MQHLIERITNCYEGSDVPFCILRVIRGADGSPQNIEFVYINRAFADIEHMPCDRLSGARLYDVYPRATRRWLELLDGAAESGKAFGAKEYMPEIKKYFSFMICPVEEDCFSCVVKDETQQKQEFENVEILLNSMPGAAFRCKHGSNGYVIYANEGFYTFIGYSREEFAAAGNTISNIVYGADKPLMLSVIHKQLEHRNSFECSGRVICRDGRTKWIMLNGAISADGNGEKSIYCIFIDMTAQKDAEAEIALRDEALRIADKSLCAGTIINRLGIEAPLLYVSDNFESFLGYTKDEFEVMYGRGYKDVIHPDDYERVLALNQKYALERPQTYEMEFRFIRKDGSVFWTIEKGTFIKDFRGEPAYLSVFIDITDQKTAEQALYERNAMFDILLENGNLSLWTYDINTHVAKLISSKNHVRPITARGLGNYPESAIAAGYVKQSSIDDMRELMRRVDEGAQTARADIWFTPMDGEPWCDRITYVNIKDVAGNTIRTIGIAEDVTEQRLGQQLYEEELEYQRTLQSENLLTKVRGNLTKNVLESYESADDVGVCQSKMPYNESVEAVAATGFTQQEKELVRRMMSADKILGDFERGQQLSAFDYRRVTNDGRVIWVNASVKTYRDMQSGDIKAFIYTVDINKEKINEQLIEAVAASEFDYIMCANLNTDEYYLYSGDPGARYMLPQSGKNFAKTVEEMNRTAVAAEDSARAVRDFMPSVIRENLKKSKIFTGSYASRAEMPPQLYKKVQYFWLDEASEQLVLTRSDVTDVVHEQQLSQELLKNALQRAEQASNAKTEFLSRMSHDIRTPMNAIINLTELAVDDMGEREKLRSDLDKIKISGDFLLGLINDILDMSRIESGRLTLSPHVYPLERFMGYMDSVFVPLFASKNIHFTIEPSDLVPALYVDEVRFNQIFFNVLSNAAKYTPEGGTVAFKVNVIRHDEKQVFAQFVIKDNGIGMSGDFLKKAFDPFERESTVTAYTGSGLGLPITRAIVEAFGGTITLESEQGCGTTVTIEMTLPFPPKDAVDQQNPGERSGRSSSEHGVAAGRILVAEDHPLNQEVITRLLKKQGFDSICVENGKQALEAVQGSQNGDFQLILMDVRMPVMDGITATRKIRALEDPVRASLPIVAMTADAFLEDRERCRDAGMDDYLSKPIDPELLYKTIQSCLERRRAAENDKHQKRGKDI